MIQGGETVFTAVCICLGISWVSYGCIPELPSKRLRGSVFRVMNNSAIYTCAAKCASDVLCKSFNFHKMDRVCQLSVAEESDFPARLHVNPDYVYSPISQWVSVALGPCQTTKCEKSQICKVRRNGQAICGESSVFNVATHKPVSVSTTLDARPENAVDGDRSTDYMEWSCFASAYADLSPWWQVDLGQDFLVLEMTIVNRQDAEAERLHSLTIDVYDKNPEVDPTVEKQTCFTFNETCTGAELKLNCAVPLVGRFVRISKTKDNTNDLLQFCEVDVIAMRLKL